MRILVAAERVGPAGGMERYIDVVLPGLVARGATVHVLARELAWAPGSAPAVPAGVTAERVAWSAEHDPPEMPQRTPRPRRRWRASGPISCWRRT